MPHIHEKIDFTAEVFIVFENKVLLRKHDKLRIWMSVGGHIELDEDPNEAALREVKEEVGLDVSLDDSLLPVRPPDHTKDLIPPYFVNRHKMSDTHEHVSFVYFAKATTNKITETLEHEKSEECHWFTKEELEANKELLPHIKFYALEAAPKTYRKPNMIKAVIFDMDGTMVETENLWKEVNDELAQMYGVKFDESIRVKMMGRKEDDALTVFKEYYKLSTSVEELMQERKKLLFQRIDRVKINPGLIELLDLIDSLHIKKAIATSAFSEFAHKVTEAIGVKDRFSISITGDMIQKGKPDPEIFLDAAKQLDVDPSYCLVLEDAQNGVEAGYNAGMKVIAIPHEHSNSHDFSKATKIINSMLEITPEVLRLI